MRCLWQCADKTITFYKNLCAAYGDGHLKRSAAECIFGCGFYVEPLFMTAMQITNFAKLYYDC